MVMKGMALPSHMENWDKIVHKILLIMLYIIVAYPWSICGDEESSG